MPPYNIDQRPTKGETATPVSVVNDPSHLQSFFQATRPNDTTAYTALDVYADGSQKLWVWDNLARYPGGGGYIVKVKLYSSLKTDVEQYTIHLYNTPPITLIADNSPYLLLEVDKRRRTGNIVMPACVTDDASNSTMARSLAVPGTTNSNLPLAFKCADNSRALFGVVQTVLGHTPAALDTLYIQLTTEPY
jgi:hypothetical protein